MDRAAGIIPPPVAPDRQLVSPPSLPCQSAFSQYQPEPYNGRCSSLPLAIPQGNFIRITLGGTTFQQSDVQLKRFVLNKIQNISKKRLIELVKLVATEAIAIM